jgi:hydrogenase maturation protease
MREEMPDTFFELMTRPGAQEVTVAGRVLRPGHRVRLRPRKGGDIIDIALAGRIAIIEGIDEDDGGALHVSVVVEDDPGLDLGMARNPAHRFFFAPEELEPVESGKKSVKDTRGEGSGTELGTEGEDGLAGLCSAEGQDGIDHIEGLEGVEGAEGLEAGRRVLVAGIGNIFRGDDGFGVAVAAELSRRALPAGVRVSDFGIRGMDLAYALGDGYHAAILVDAVPRGRPPGTVCVIEPDQPDEDAALDSHQMNPLAVLNLARTLGPLPRHLIIVGCEPDPDTVGDDSMSMDLSGPVAEAVGRAADMVVHLARGFVAGSSMAAAIA